ncbi:hypothetical protein A45J_2397 [hot springs metagenome]|uniref:Uncharacterized protein n=1 Tax=hot springs metagenome TaxID=433727 RepID=A0A5J4L4K8_9ZZZZ
MNSSVLNVFFVLGVLAASFFAYTLKDFFFTGYSISATPLWKGSFTAATNILLSIALIINVNKKRRIVTFKNTIFNRYFVIYFIFVVLLSSLGGRTWAVSFLIMLLVYYKRVKIKNFVFITICVILFSIVMPFLRTGALLQTQTSDFINLTFIKDMVFIRYII